MTQRCSIAKILDGTPTMNLEEMGFGAIALVMRQAALLKFIRAQVAPRNGPRGIANEACPVEAFGFADK
jgi:hypothetical protein